MPADRYLLRHETANEAHYTKLHPARQTLSNRIRCLRDLKDIGYQTGAGMMIGAPYQTAETLAQDMEFLADLRPEMVGMGPFLPHRDTPFRDFPHGSAELTLYLLSLVRLLLPDALLPATTALGTLDASGRQQGVLSGCNVVMPNLSPMAVRQKYLLYDNKAGIGDDGESSLRKLRAQMQGKIACFAGQSGVGKSTLLNALLDLHLQTGEISRIERGKHTTRHAQLIETGGLRVMDTPGFSLLEFDQVMNPVELMDYYPEFQPYQGCCRFQPCYHGSEPGCAVIQAAREGKISPARLERYHELLEKTRQLWRERYD